ncbi:chemotaxis protein CheB [soil metagenome]
MKYEAVVIGVSMGGLAALREILSKLPATFPWPIIIVQHISPQSDSLWISILDRITALTVREAEEKDAIKPGFVYLAPPNYHLLVEKNRTFSLSADDKVNYARPSIDVLFESAADAYKHNLIGVILTGANHDGAKGLKAIQDYGGLVIVQDPQTAEAQMMPKAAIQLTKTNYVFSLQKIVDLLILLSA